MHLSGQLSDWSIDDLLQIMQVTKKTGSLDIAGDRRGRLHFKDGFLTGAELNGWSTDEVLAEVDALRSLEGEVVDAGLFEASGVRVNGEVDDDLTIKPEDWRLLASLVQPFTFNQLEAKLGRGGAVRVLHTLHRLGVAEPLDEEEAGDWLGRLAGDMSPDSEPAWLDPVEPEAPSVDHEEPAAEQADEDPELVEEETVEEKKKVSPLAEARIIAEAKGVSAPASTTLTDGVYDEIRRLRSRVSDNR